MSIGGITGNLHQQYPLGMIGSTSQSSGAAGAFGSSSPTSQNGAVSPVGGLFDALMQALTQSGALRSTTATTSAAGTASTSTDAAATASVAAGSSSASGSSAGSSSSMTPQQAMQAFIQSLVTALQAQGSDSSTVAGNTTNGTSAAATVACASGTDATPAAGGSAILGHHKHGKHMASALQDLIEKVDTDSSAPSTSASATTTAGSSSTTGTTASISSMQNSFQNLLSSVGGSGGTSLSGFLTNFAKDLSGMSAVGNLVNTQA